MNRTKQFAINALSTAIYQVSLIVTSFLVPKTIIACYGSEINGLVTSFTQFISYFNVVEAGISGAAVYMLYKPLANACWDRVSEIVSSARRYYYQSGVLFVGMVGALALVYPSLVMVDGLSSFAMSVLVFALGAKGFLEFFTLAKYRALLTADQKNWVIQFASTLYQLISTTIICLMASYGFDLLIVYVSAVFAVFVRTILLVVYTRLRYRNVDFHASGKRVALEQRWDALYLQLLAAVQQGAPVIIATIVFSDLRIVSVFSVYMLVANGLQQICGFLGTGLQASFGDLIARGETELLGRVYAEYEVLVYSFLAIAVSCGLALIMPFMSLYTSGFTDADYIDGALGFLCISNVLFYHLKTPQGLMVIAAGMYKRTRVQTTIQALILIVCSGSFGYCFGPIGIMFGILLSNFYRDVDLLFFIPRNVTNTRVMDSIKRISICFVKIVVALIPAMFLPGALITSWSKWIVAAIVYVVWSGLVVVVLTRLCEETEYRSLCSRVGGLVGK